MKKFCLSLSLALSLFAVAFPGMALPCFAQDEEEPPAEAVQKAEPTSDPLIDKANEAFYSRRLQEARSLCQNAIDQKGFSLNHLTPESYRYFLNRTACDIGLHEYSPAKKTLEHLQKYLNQSFGKKEMVLPAADTAYLRAEILYKSGDDKAALPLYQEALNGYMNCMGDECAALSQPLEGMAVCLRKAKRLGRAISAQQQVAHNDYVNLGASSFRFAETLKFLVQMLSENGEDEKAGVIRDLYVTSLRTGMAHDLGDKYREKLATGAITPDQAMVIRERVKRVVVGNISREDVRQRMETIVGVPKDLLDQGHGRHQLLDFDHWVSCRKELVRPAATVLINPEVPQVALIYCIHGLGLHGTSFSKWGQAMADRGYPVLMPDIRGFGGNAKNKGLDTFDPEESLKDILRNLNSLKVSVPDLPVVLLGESMGGAFALQTAARHPELISAAVCSVPSGSRFGALRDGITVARSVLRRRKRVDVGKMIVKKATKDEAKQESWEADPDARLDLSPKELIKFQEFMNQNDKAAKAITDLPILFLQGAQDGLVKPMGTAELFQAVVSKDKDFFVVGMEEHLIFEDENFPEWIPDSLEAWLKNKLTIKGKYSPR